MCPSSFTLFTLQLRPILVSASRVRFVLGFHSPLLVLYYTAQMLNLSRIYLNSQRLRIIQANCVHGSITSCVNKCVLTFVLQCPTKKSQIFHISSFLIITDRSFLAAIFQSAFMLNTPHCSHIHASWVNQPIYAI